MDNLDLLKKDWKKQEKSIPQLSYDEIYKLIWKRSSSIVKWIFFISIIEFALGAVLNIFIADDEYWAKMEEYNLTIFLICTYVVSYIITFYFIYKFYTNYKAINATDSASVLMKTILKVRKTVKYYIGFILISSAFVFVFSMIFILRNHVLTAEPVASNMSFDWKQWLLFIGGTLLALAVILGVIWLIYTLVYGILLRRLHRNYKELKKLEM
ncbi:membrane protein [Christiangramia portivictoriae]|uniref:membrane protein n=1 Tax=Christiangramia portivictoriae TaxID=326069 RepID=UPI00040DB81A|nr:membrane protein [Christiangramia portivictoriae]